MYVAQHSINDVAMNGNNVVMNLLLVTNNPIEFKKPSIEVQDFGKSIDHFIGICGIYFKFIKEQLKDHNM